MWLKAYICILFLMSTKILAIETSCDETAMALVEISGTKGKPEFKILAEAISSQISVHRPFGGVVPMLAKREHIKNLPIVLKKLKLKVKPDQIAVTIGPGLAPALWTGINFANDLAKKIKTPIIGINHLEGHIYSNWLKNQEIKFPAVVLVVSGGHTILLLMKNMKKWRKLGETRDDAVGEAFDKVARMLKLPYPGGPEIEKLAGKGNAEAIDFPRPMIHAKNYDFSFSGLKTAVLYYLRDHKKPVKKNVCASFQQAVIDVLSAKTMGAVKEFKAKSVLLCGGVAANKALQSNLKTESRKLKAKFYVPELKFNTDNAVMIAAATYLGNHHPTKKALPNLNL